MHLVLPAAHNRRSAATKLVALSIRIMLTKYFTNASLLLHRGSTLGPAFGFSFNVEIDTPELQSTGFVVPVVFKY